MKVSLQKGYRINLGNYEHVEVSAHITIGEEDFDADELEGLDRDERMALLQREAARYMTDYLEPELDSAAEVSQATDSILSAPPPPRRERSTRRRK